MVIFLALDCLARSFPPMDLMGINETDIYDFLIHFNQVRFAQFSFRRHYSYSRPFPWGTEPWLHVTYFFIGGWIGQQWVRLEKELVMDINEIRADKGMPPLVGTNAMLGLKYVRQD